MKYDYDEALDLSEIPEEVIDSEIRLIATNEMIREKTPATIALNDFHVGNTNIPIYFGVLGAKQPLTKCILAWISKMRI